MDGARLSRYPHLLWPRFGIDGTDAPRRMEVDLNGGCHTLGLVRQGRHAVRWMTRGLERAWISETGNVHFLPVDDAHHTFVTEHAGPFRFETLILPRGHFRSILASEHHEPPPEWRRLLAPSDAILQAFMIHVCAAAAPRRPTCPGLPAATAGSGGMIMAAATAPARGAVRARAPAARASRTPTGGSMSQVKHFGVFAFKPGISAERIDHCFAEMRSMVGRIPGLLDMAHGVYESPEGLDDGFTHGFIMTFENAAARDAYLPHPEHERVKAIVVPCLERVVVFDFALLPGFHRSA